MVSMKEGRKDRRKENIMEEERGKRRKVERKGRGQREGNRSKKGK